MMKSILCIDPGGTMGVAVFRVLPDEPALLFDVYQTSNDPLRVSEIFYKWLSQERHADEFLVIIEDWEYRHGVPTDARLACEPIGIIDYLCAITKTPLIRQKPGVRSSIPDDEGTLKPLGYWSGARSHKDGNARQATRHGLSYITRKMKHLPTLEALFPRPQ